MTTSEPVCYKCRHFKRISFDEVKCIAFPEGIPEVIFYESNDHSIPIKSEGLQKLYLDLASGKRKPKTAKEREMLKEIRSIEKKGGMIDFELE